RVDAFIALCKNPVREFSRRQATPSRPSPSLPDQRRFGFSRFADALFGMGWLGSSCSTVSRFAGSAPQLSPIAAALSEAVPFVGPETIVRRSGVPLRARIGANESPFGPAPSVLAAMQAAAL